ncbi:hypothetical protein [Egbenema bharatensis]|uniref:hypothetical protein n=1 Tax=Egbenema bharatensis TaxID=3463334 RepID=UPI003A879BB5
MPYNKFTLKQAQQSFGLQIRETDRLFSSITPVQPSDLLRQTLANNISLATAINTEVARFGMLIQPIVLEVRQLLSRKVSVFFGTEFTVDPARDLSGFPDAVISRGAEQFFITAPVVTLVEAKNENIVGGLGQCAAEMVAAQIFNQQEGQDIPAVYGCVTTGTLWRFLRLEGTVLAIDPVDLPLEPVDRLLGIFVSILES